MTETSVIASVCEYIDGYDITADTLRIYLSKRYGYIPEVGEPIVVTTYQGSRIRGLCINGTTVFAETDAELEIEQQEQAEAYERKLQEGFVANVATMDADYDALPDNFKKRIDRFRKNNPRFRVDYEGYELFVCKEALKIAEALKKPEIVNRFYKMQWEERIRHVPTLNREHSSNTLDASCSLACVHLKSPDMVWKVCGALSPLVGSKEYNETQG